MHFIVIGSGWYGCHLSKFLLENGHTVNIVDKTNDFFCGSSSKNQNRLHLGFHYPRSDDTIRECIVGYNMFVDKYSHCLKSIAHNYYFISQYNSLISFEDYCSKYDTFEVRYTVHDFNANSKIKHVLNKALLVDEQFIDFNSAKEYFKRELGQYMLPIDTYDTIQEIVQHINMKSDYIINCTYNHIDPIEFDTYELFITLLYRIDTPDIFAYTVMDGNFFSIYPYNFDDKIYSVTSVELGVLYRGIDNTYKPSLTDINTRIDEIKAYITDNVYNWDKIATYVDYYTSWKTKPNTNTDDRSLRYKQDGNILHFYGGKITGIFHAEKVLKDIIEKEI
jgi:hypothetical protein